MNEVYIHINILTASSDVLDSLAFFDRFVSDIQLLGSLGQPAPLPFLLSDSFA